MFTDIKGASGLQMTGAHVEHLKLVIQGLMGQRYWKL